MDERHPDDATLLALTQDEATGVPYIPTGASPYHLLFRRMLHRLLRAAERANDLRVYQVDDLSVSVRPGRCFVASQPVAFDGEASIPVDPDATTWLWLDEQGQVQADHAALPEDRGTFIPLAKIIAGPTAIESITDLRGEAMLSAASAATMGITASADEINRALDGASEDVTAIALSFLCAGPTSTVDALHRHEQMLIDTDAEAGFRLINPNSGDQAAVALRFALPGHFSGDTRLEMDRDTGWLRQRRPNGPAYYLLGVVHVQRQHEGQLTTDQVGKLIGAAPLAGEVVDVALSLGANLETNDNDDHIRARVKVNGDELCTLDPSISVADGPGFRSTAQSDGAAAIVKDDGTQMLTAGDVLSLDLLRTANGTVTSEASDVVVLVTLRPLGPA